MNKTHATSHSLSNHNFISAHLDESAQKIWDIIAQHGEIRIIGGWVRDTLNCALRHHTSDIDFATTLSPHTVISILQSASIRTKSTGLAHGTVTAILNRKSYEITTLRRDDVCYGRNASVSFLTTSDDAWLIDAERRDFTINAMSVNKHMQLFDYFNGLNDLKHNRVRFIGNPLHRIQEDYLRILRLFRFAAYMNDEIPQEYIEIVRAEAHNIKLISIERVWQEVRKILSTPGAEKLFATLAHLVLSHIDFPHIDHNDKQISALRFWQNEPMINLASYITCYAKLRNTSEQHNMYNLIEQLSLSLRMSKAEAKRLMAALYDIPHHHDINERLKYIAMEPYKYECAVMRMHVQGAISSDQAEEYLNLASLLHNKSMPLDGNDIIKLGIKGKNIAHALSYAKIQWLQSNCTHDKAQLLKAVKQHLLATN